ncbi:type II toxin-antitoxin system HicB family antitoxin [Deefgea salmonis]|uniref:Type II toxin-antitoxin system HicB family antitoxin n=1 Tax=Deefgea salmonis TaxID=2875502 RepID=A0ABS8BG92_9NEIS|nr:type II toxin-antitoxin system HicB family antitoxin [Deefgea salmonis]MCB5194720.1 type II toxin-antitoxin system HicB family antitoxin [Deefgea salmonis]
MSDLLEHNGFFGTVEYSKDDQCLIGEVLFIEGKLVYAADSLPELKLCFENAVDEYLQMCSERGIDAQRPFKGMFNVRLDPALHKCASLKARQQSISLNQFVTRAIEQAVEEPKPHVHQHFHVGASHEQVYEMGLSRVFVHGDSRSSLSYGVKH